MSYRILILALGIAWIAPASSALAKNDYAPKIRHYANLRARLQVKAAAKAHAIETLRERGVKIPERRSIRLFGHVFGGPKVKVKTRLDGAKREGDGTTLVYGVTARVGRKAYTQFVARDAATVRTMVSSLWDRAVSPNPNPRPDLPNFNMVSRNSKVVSDFDKRYPEMTNTAAMWKPQVSGD